MWGRKSTPAQKFLSSGTHESCGELSAVAELVATTPIHASVFGIRESQSKDTQDNMASSGSGMRWRLESVDIGAEDTTDRVMRPSWLQRIYLRGFTIHWSATLLDTSGGQVGDPCRKPDVEKLPPEPRRHRRGGHGLGVFFSTIANHCERQIVSMS